MSYQILKQKIFEFDKENKNKTVVRGKNMNFITEEEFKKIMRLGEVRYVDKE